MNSIKRLLFRLGLFLAITFEDKDSPAFNKWETWAACSLDLRRYRRDEAVKARAMAAWYTSHYHQLKTANDESLRRYRGY